MGDERFLSNVFKRFLFLLHFSFLTFYLFFSARFLHLCTTLQLQNDNLGSLGSDCRYLTPIVKLQYEMSEINVHLPSSDVQYSTVGPKSDTLEDFLDFLIVMQTVTE